MTEDQLLLRLNREPDDRIGYCRCGCGQKAPIAIYANATRGWIRGQPKEHCNGHASRTLTSVHVDSGSGCWVWIKGCQPNGYGASYTDDGKHKRKQAHRMVWEWINGDIPKGLELDHICRNRPCVNPSHLRLVTRAENTQYGLIAVHTPAKVKEIRKLRKEGLSYGRIASKLGIKRSNIHAVVSRRTWKNID